MSNRRRITIRASLLRNLVLLIGVLSGSLILATVITARSAVAAFSESLVQATGARIETSLEAYFEPVEQDLFLVARLAREEFVGAGQTRIDWSDVNRLNSLFVVIHDRLPRISSVNLGDEDGNGYLILWRPGLDGWENRIVNPEKYPGREIWQQWSEPKKREKEWQENGGYDPRERPWYKGAVAHDRTGVYWTAPYKFRRTGDPGITAALVLHPSDRKPVVVAFDILLDDISAFTRNADVSDRGLAFIMTDPPGMEDEVPPLVLGLPRDERFVTEEARRAAYLKSPEKIGVPVLANATEAWFRRHEETGRLDGFFEFENDGETWWGGLEGFTLGGKWVVRGNGREERVGGRHFWVGVALPESDVLGPVRVRRWQIVGATLFALGIAVFLAFRLAKKYSVPLKALVKEGERMRELILDKEIEVESDLVEVDQLAETSKRVRGALLSFSRYVPTEIVRELMDRGEAARIGGRAATLSVLFTDIRGFTTIAEEMNPTELTEHMSEYFEHMITILRSEGATIDKLVGDAIVAFWGAPSPDPEHARHAVQAALRCREFLEGKNREWIERGQPALPTCFGIATGPVVVGNVGAPSRLTYTALGDSMNVASRLEALNRRYGTEILASGSVREATGGRFEWREVGLAAVKGKRKAVDIFEPLGIAGEVDEAVLDRARRFEGALAWFRSRHFAEAVELLDALAGERPDDLSVARLQKLCRNYIENPPGQDWDAIARFEVK